MTNAHSHDTTEARRAATHSHHQSGPTGVHDIRGAARPLTHALSGTEWLPRSDDSRDRSSRWPPNLAAAEWSTSTAPVTALSAQSVGIKDDRDEAGGRDCSSLES